MHQSGELACCAGIPTDNDRVFCTSSAVNETCYFYNNTFLGRDRAQQTCEGMGGWLVAYNTGDEQLQVENYFTGKWCICLSMLRILLHSCTSAKDIDSDCS
jgi:hypothetical protein